MKIFNKKLAKILFTLFFSMLLIGNANALPSFARQTGMSCVACHTSFPELTPFGREFKLNGYTLGDTQWFPFAVMATASNQLMVRCVGQSFSATANCGCISF